MSNRTRILVKQIAVVSQELRSAKNEVVEGEFLIHEKLLQAHLCDKMVMCPPNYRSPFPRLIDNLLATRDKVAALTMEQELLTRELAMESAIDEPVDETCSDAVICHACMRGEIQVACSFERCPIGSVAMA
jgi:hypothetical protein